MAFQQPLGVILVPVRGQRKEGVAAESAASDIRW
jgi:hypothetical protein